MISNIPWIGSSRERSSPPTSLTQRIIVMQKSALAAEWQHDLWLEDVPLASISRSRSDGLEFVF